MRRLNTLLCLLLASAGAAAQAATGASDCGTPQAVLDRYVEAVGGEAAVNQLKSLAIEAHAEEPHTFNPQSTAHYKYWFKWLAPNRVAVRWHYLLSPGTALFDGAHWSNFDGRLSHNYDALSPLQLKRRARYPYLEDPQWMMYRIAANPIQLAADKGLYGGFESLPGTSATCVLQAEWTTIRRDKLTFNAETGLLEAWKIQVGPPEQDAYFEFRFDDYRPAGPVKIPWSIYFDSSQTTITVTRVVYNPSLTEAQFEPRSEE